MILSTPTVTVLVAKRMISLEIVVTVDITICLLSSDEVTFNPFFLTMFKTKYSHKVFLSYVVIKYWTTISVLGL